MSLLVINCIELRICELKLEIENKRGSEIEAEIPDDERELAELSDEVERYWREE